MKKTRKTILSILSCVLSLTYLAACDDEENNEEHKCSFVNYVSDNNATCTQDGTKTAKCEGCDKTDTIADVGSKLGHTYGGFVSNNDATCLTDGTRTKTCSVCNDKVTETIPNSKLGHDFNNYVSDGNATCTQDGTKTSKCSRCEVKDTVTDPGTKTNHTYASEYSYDDDGHFLAATCGCDLEMDREPHTFGEPTIVAPTATETGKKIYQCEYCDYSYFDVIPASGEHVFDKKCVSPKYIVSNPTCTSPAKYYYSCECGKCGYDTFEYGDKTNHNFVYYEATEDKGAYLKCTTCGYRTDKDGDYSNVADDSFTSSQVSSLILNSEFSFRDLTYGSYVKTYTTCGNLFIFSREAMSYSTCYLIKNFNDYYSYLDYCNVVGEEFPPIFDVAYDLISADDLLSFVNLGFFPGIELANKTYRFDASIQKYVSEEGGETCITIENGKISNIETNIWPGLELEFVEFGAPEGFDYNTLSKIKATITDNSLVDGTISLTYSLLPNYMCYFHEFGICLTEDGRAYLKCANCGYSTLCTPATSETGDDKYTSKQVSDLFLNSPLVFKDGDAEFICYKNLFIEESNGSCCIHTFKDLKYGMILEERFDCPNIQAGIEMQENKAITESYLLTFEDYVEFIASPAYPPYMVFGMLSYDEINDCYVGHSPVDDNVVIKIENGKITEASIDYTNAELIDKEIDLDLLDKLASTFVTTAEFNNDFENPSYSIMYNGETIGERSIPFNRYISDIHKASKVSPIIENEYGIDVSSFGEQIVEKQVYNLNTNELIKYFDSGNFIINVYGPNNYGLYFYDLDSDTLTVIKTTIDNIYKYVEEDVYSFEDPKLVRKTTSTKIFTPSSEVTINETTYTENLDSGSKMKNVINFDLDSNSLGSVFYFFDDETNEYIARNSATFCFDENGKEIAREEFSLEGDFAYEGIRKEFSFDENDRKISEIQYMWNPDQNCFNKTEKYDFEYLENNFVAKIHSSWDSENSEWVCTGKKIEVLDENNSDYTDYFEEYSYDADNSSWVGQSKILRYMSGNYEVEEAYAWDSENDEWVGMTRSDRIYQNGLLIDEITYEWDVENKQFVPVAKVTYEYENGEISEECNYSWNESTQSWSLVD